MIWTTAPWRRAPGLALRAPAVVVAVFLAAGVLALAAASGPLFVSSTGSAALSREAGKNCPEALLPAFSSPQPGVRASTPVDRPAALGRVRSAVAGAYAATGLPAPDQVLIAGVTLTGDRPVTGLARAGALEHVAVSRRLPGSGVLVSDLAAVRLGVRPGDVLVTTDGGRVRVVGLYTDLNGPGFGTGVPRYWCTWSRLILTTLDFRPPPLLLATDDAALLALARGGPGADTTWYAPVPVERSTLAEARTVLAAAARVPAEVSARAADVAYEGVAGGDLDDAVELAARQQAGVAGPVRPTATAGTLVALLLVAGAGAYWAERRRREVTLLAARGAGPVALAGKAVLELLLPAAAGSVAGWYAARALVGVVGPSPRLEPAATVTAAGAAGLGLLGGLVLLGIAAVARQRAAERRRPDRGALRWVPWEAALLGAAVWAYLRIRSGGGVTTDGRVISVSPLLIAYPLLGLAGGLVLAARLAGALAGRAGRRGGRLPVPAYLAARRLTGGGLVTLALGALVAVPAGVLVYGGVVTSSVEGSVDTKAAIYTGAERAVVTRSAPATAIDPGGHGTVVSVVSAVLPAAAGDREVGVLGVDPATFARFAATDGLGYDLAAVVGRLGGDRAVLAGCGGCGSVTAVRMRTTTLPVRVVDRPAVFPGMRQLRAPTLVVARDTLARVDRYADRREEVWTTAAELPALSAALDAGGVSADRQKTPDNFLDVTDLLPLTWSLGYLQALAALTGLVGVAGLLLHLGARQRAATVAYPMLRRMGLGRGRHLASLAYELAVLLGVAAATGAGLGYAAAALVHPRLDLDPEFPPPPALRVPLPLLAGLAAATVLLVLLAALATQRTADRINPADALRAAG